MQISAVKFGIGYLLSHAIVLLFSLIDTANAFSCVAQTWKPHAAKLMLAPVSPLLRGRCIQRPTRLVTSLKGTPDDNQGVPRPIPPFDLAALAGQQPENFVPAEFLALHEMIVGATAKDSNVASFEMTSLGSALAEEMQKAYTNR